MESSVDKGRCPGALASNMPGKGRVGGYSIRWRFPGLKLYGGKPLCGTVAALLPSCGCSEWPKRAVFGRDYLAYRDWPLPVRVVFLPLPHVHAERPTRAVFRRTYLAYRYWPLSLRVVPQPSLAMGRPGLQNLKPGPYPAQTMVGPTRTRPDPKKPGPPKQPKLFKCRD